MKTVVITGGSGAIGSAIAELFKKEGYSVAVIYNKNKEKAEQLKKEGINVYQADVGDEQSVKEAIKRIKSDFGRITCLINSTGITKRACLQDCTGQDFDEIFSANVKGAFLFSKEVISDMLFCEKGDIINISSVWGERPASCEVLYSASKGALNMFTVSLARELCFTPIKVNAVALGFVDTPMNKGLSQEEIEDFLEENGFARLVTPQEVAQCCLKLVNGKKSGKIIKLFGKR